MKQTVSSPRKLDAPGERAFFIFLSITLIGMYIWSVIESAVLHQPLRFILFTFLMIVHLAGHWSIFLIVNRPRWHMIYILAQGALAFGITLLAGNIGIILGLYMAMIGEGIGLMRGQKLNTALAIGYYMLLSMFSYVLLFGWNTILWWALASLPMTLFVGIYVTLYSRQAEARERAQSLAVELETANKQLSDYAARVEDLTIANERQRMARELHDTLSQGIAGLILQLEAAEAHLASDHPQKASAIVANAMVQARTTLSDARRAIDDLRKTSADDFDSALRLEISRFTDATGIPCIFQSGQIPPLAEPVQETVVRAVAEGLTNAAHHAQARQVAVNVSVKDKSLLVTIQDDGQGFDADAIPSGHYGLLGIRERVRLVNGTFEIQSNNKGTTLKIEIPL